MATQSATTKPKRETLGAVRSFLDTKDPVLYVFRDIGDRCRGTVVGAKLVDSEFAGNARKNAAGVQKKHLQVYLTSPEGDKLVLNVQSQNQKESLASALETAKLDGLAVNDFLSMEYIGDDEAIRDGLNPSRQFRTEITPGE